jgi:hypothetical protein
MDESDEACADVVSPDGWPPRVRMDVHLPDLEANLKETGIQARRVLTGFLDNTWGDIGRIREEFGECWQALGNVGRLVAGRAVEYHTSITRILTDAQLVPINIVQACGGSTTRAAMRGTTRRWSVPR